MLKVKRLGTVEYFESVEKLVEYFGKDYDPVEDGQGEIRVFIDKDEYVIADRLDWEMMMEEQEA